MNYAFLLDFFPLVEEISYENAVLGSVLQVTALDALEDPEMEKRLMVLLKLAGDLGYASPEVVAFLIRRIGLLPQRQE
ncbi:hypothetical protein GOV11_01795 [Candidatus Woesearchaeota archaeon]|nr:hypothetical protein [Candidatus Woesearchaeota archaeon]